MKNYLLLGAFILIGVWSTAQEIPKWSFGVETGVNISPAGFQEADWLEGNGLLRYSAGLLFRRDLNKNFKVSWGGLSTRIHLLFDTGLNFAAKGYDYDAGQFSNFKDQFAVELPLLFVMKEGHNAITWSWRKKHLHVFTKIGLKLSYSPLQTVQFSDAEVNSNNSLSETAIVGGWNILYHYEIGLLKQPKGGASSSLSFGVNLGLLRTVKGEIERMQDNEFQGQNFERRGSYFSLNWNYFFAKNRKRPPKIIYPVIICPKF